MLFSLPDCTYNNITTNVCTHTVFRSCLYKSHFKILCVFTHISKYELRKLQSELGMSQGVENLTLNLPGVVG